MFFYFTDLQSTETFRQSRGPKIVVDILNGCNQNINVLDSGFSVVAAAATGNEVLKESFMDLKIDELLLQSMKGQNKGNIRSLYEALRLLLTPDDNRVLASQVSISCVEILVSYHENYLLCTGTTSNDFYE